LKAALISFWKSRNHP